MADQRMDISSTISDFMSSGPTDLLSSSLGTSSVDCNRRWKGSSTDYQEMDTDKDDPHRRSEYTEHQGRLKNAREAHSQIEKQRQDKMNSFIDELASLVPRCNTMSRKLDELTVLRMAVQHMKTLRGGTNPCTEANYKPTFLSDDELKHLRAADGFLFVVGCDRGKILFIFNYSQKDLIGQSLFDDLHPKDIAKVKEQLSSSHTTARERLTAAKTGLPVTTDTTPGHLDYVLEMKCNRPSVKVEDKDFPSTCSKKKADRKTFCTIHSTDNEPDNEGCNLSCLVAIGRLLSHTFVFVDQRATAILAYLPQELLGTSCYEYFHQDDIGHLAECHRQVVQMREKITTNCYKFKIKDGSFITLQSRWFSFMNPWTKEVEYMVSTNTVVLANVLEGGTQPSHSSLRPAQHGQHPKEDSPHCSRDSRGNKGWGRKNRVLTFQLWLQPIEHHEYTSPHASSPGGKKILNGGTPDIPSSGYPHSDSSSILGENPHIGMDMIDNDQGSSSPSNDEAAVAVTMSLLEADAGLGGPVDFSDLPWVAAVNTTCCFGNRYSIKVHFWISEPLIPVNLIMCNFRQSGTKPAPVFPHH
uniref:Aryl hydrocarbon receptor nuclear translocator-like protein 1 n=1 Tax=Microcebus murinus TaxID=30608 RepID=A0A8C5W3B0_MICMU